MGIIAIVAELMRLGIPIATEIVEAVNAMMTLSGANRAPTADEQAALDAGLAASHKALQEAKQAP